MNPRTRRVVTMVLLVTIVTVASGCELGLPVDCSGINQPDMGGLVCLGANAIAIQAAVVALLGILAVLFGGGLPA